MLDIDALVHDYVARDRESESGKMWPSSLGGCILQEMYRVKGYKETDPMPESTRWKLYRYGWYEQPVVNALRWGECDVETQVLVGNKYWSGKIDALVTYPGKPQAILEIKSISPYAVNKSDLPYKHHLLQARCYWFLMTEAIGSPLSASVSIIYVSRWNDDDIPTIRELDVTPTAEECEAVHQEMEQYEYWFEQEDLPACPYNHPSDHPWNCMSNFWNNTIKQKPWVVQCPYFGHCWPGYVDPARGYSEEGEQEDVYIPF